MPTVVNLSTPAARKRRGWDRGWTPFVDWTGHVYKPPSECTVDYSHVGRECNRARNPKDGGRTMPTMPGGSTRPYTPPMWG